MPMTFMPKGFMQMISSISTALPRGSMPRGSVISPPVMPGLPRRFLLPSPCSKRFAPMASAPRNCA